MTDKTPFSKILAFGGMAIMAGNLYFSGKHIDANVDFSSYGESLGITIAAHASATTDSDLIMINQGEANPSYYNLDAHYAQWGTVIETV